MNEIRVPVPGIEVPSSFMYAHPTRLADAFVPAVERIFLPAMTVEPWESSISIVDGIARPSAGTRNPLRRLRGLRRIKAPGVLLFDCRADTDRNPAHQLCNLLSKALMARRHLGNDGARISLIYRRGVSSMTRQIADLLGFPILETDGNVEGSILNIARLNPVGLYPEVFDVRLDYSDPTPEKVYIARRGTRYVENDAEITAFLAARGFVKVYFEDLTVLKQWATMAGASKVVCIHGAALAALVFNRRGLDRKPDGFRIVELFGAGYVVDFYRVCAAQQGALWTGVRGKITADIVRDLDEKNLPRAHQGSPFLIDPGTLEMALDHSTGEG
jgi:hypothetical protein